MFPTDPFSAKNFFICAPTTSQIINVEDLGILARKLRAMGKPITPIPGRLQSQYKLKSVVMKYRYQ